MGIRKKGTEVTAGLILAGWADGANQHTGSQPIIDIYREIQSSKEYC